MLLKIRINMVSDNQGSDEQVLTAVPFKACSESKVRTRLQY